VRFRIRSGPAALAAVLLLVSAAAGSRSALARTRAASEPSADVAAGYPCIPSGFDLCLLEGRFRATLSWNDGSGPRPAWVAQPRTDSASSSSGLLYFYGSVPSNWEALVKIVDGCRTNEAFWVLVSAATGFGWELVVTDELAGVTKTFTHPLDGHASGVADFSSFSTCAVPTPTPSPTPEPWVTPTPTPVATSTPVVTQTPVVTPPPTPVVTVTPTPGPTPPYALVSYDGGLSGAFCGSSVVSASGYEFTAGSPAIEVSANELGPFGIVFESFPLPCDPVTFYGTRTVTYGYRYVMTLRGTYMYNEFVVTGFEFTNVGLIEDTADPVLP